MFYTCIYFILAYIYILFKFCRYKHSETCRIGFIKVSEMLGAVGVEYIAAELCSRRSCIQRLGSTRGEGRSLLPHSRAPINCTTEGLTPAPFYPHLSPSPLPALYLLYLLRRLFPSLRIRVSLIYFWFPIKCILCSFWSYTLFVCRCTLTYNIYSLISTQLHIFLPFNAIPFSTYHIYLLH